MNGSGQPQLKIEPDNTCSERFLGLFLGVLSIYLKAPQDQAVYEQSFKEAITELAQEQLGKKRRDEFRDGSLRMNIPTTNP